MWIRETEWPASVLSSVSLEVGEDVELHLLHLNAQNSLTQVFSLFL
jgi:hypothetical protein